LFMSFSSFFILLSTYVKPIFTFFQTWIKKTSTKLINK
jgi:hypothetical protein